MGTYKSAPHSPLPRTRADRMIRTSVLHQTHLLVPKEYRLNSPESVSFRLREQECVSLIKQCRNMEEFKQTHCQILKWGMFWSSFCASNLLATCALDDWGSMDYAYSILVEIDEPGSFQFNTMIRGHVQDMNPEEAILMYNQMLDMGTEPDGYTYPSLLKACARLPALEEGMQIHGHIFKLGIEEDVLVLNSLINMYGKCKEIRRACAVFEQMDQKTISFWSALITAHASMGMWYECLGLFGAMSSERCWRAEESILVTVLSACTHLGGLNVIVETSLVNMYVKCGSPEKGLCLFQRMANKNQLSYTVMISGLALHGQGQEALRIFDEMLGEGFEPDDAVYIGVLSTCSRAGLVEEGVQLFDRMRLEHKMEPRIQHYGCLIDLRGRAGMVDEAFEIIKNMPMKPNDVLWRSLLGACKVHQNVQLGEVAAKNLLQLNLDNTGDYVVLSNLYAQSQRWQHVARTRTEMVRRRLTQTPGFSFVEVKRKVYKFVSQDMSRPQ
ncbi:hypothetical protein RJ640_003363 [Escallonia rubra]|uniref:Pentatricopeptide repeat-containing protein n=1 Tax=Escallonia rubra TaxID=112253 RepID=A0AA88U9L1_9ASTE|nr:hypothetical protein RJ640_003363 [Escallonia rubra]